MKHMLLLVMLSASAVFASATAAQAEVVTNETASYQYSGYVPCANGGAGELVNGTIDVHVLETSTLNDNLDGSHFLFTPRGRLVGAITGDVYRLTGVTHGTYNEGLENGKYVLTYINRYQLIGQGKASNLAVRETAHITEHGDEVIVQHDDFSIECS
jgi:hypothetical protein